MQVQKLSPVNIQSSLNKVGQSRALELFDKKCCEIFDGFKAKPYDLAGNIYRMGKFFKLEQSRLNEEKVQKVLHYIQDLLHYPTNARNKKFHINAVNIIYSTLLKSISPNLIIKEKIQPETYKKIIDDSIKLYRTKPLKEDVDYRHILGRMVSLKDMVLAIREKLRFLPERFKVLDWNSSRQLDFVNVLEIILNKYDKTSSNFVVKSIASDFCPAESFDYDSVKQNYNRNLIKTLVILHKELVYMMQNPIKNSDGIKNRLELIHFYFDKIPFDSPNISTAFRILNRSKKYEKDFYTRKK